MCRRGGERRYNKCYSLKEKKWKWFPSSRLSMYIQNISPELLSQSLQLHLPHRAFIHTHSKTNSSTYHWIFSIHPVVLYMYSFLCMQPLLKEKISAVNTEFSLHIHLILAKWWLQYLHDMLLSVYLYESGMLLLPL